MYFPVQFSVRSTRKKYLGFPFLLQGAQKAVGGREKKYPTFFFFFLFFLLGTQNFRGGGGALFVTERGGANRQSYATDAASVFPIIAPIIPLEKTFLLLTAKFSEPRNARSNVSKLISMTIIA